MPPTMPGLSNKLQLDLPALLTLPECAIHHLLFPQTDLERQFRMSLAVLDDTTCEFFSSRTTSETQMFVDGSSVALNT